MIKAESNNTIDTACLNSLKFFAASIVAFCWHYQHFSPSGNPLCSILPFSYSLGWLMVEFFFILSGFGMYFGYKDRVLNRNISFWKYIRKRLEKIYPLFFIALLLVTLIQALFIRSTGTTFVYENYDFYHFFMNIILCQDGLFGVDWSFNAPSWCISISFVLYVLFFVIFFFAKSKEKATGIFVFLSALFCPVLLLNLNYPLVNTLIARGIISFSIGIVIAFFFKNKASKASLILGYITLIFAFVFYAVLIGFYQSMVVKQLLFMFLMAPLVILAALYIPWLNRILSCKIFLYLGSLSMEIYLFHFIIQCLIRYVDIKMNLNLNYGSRCIWFSYILITLLVSIIYKGFVSEFATKVFGKVFDRLEDLVCKK